MVNYTFERDGQCFDTLDENLAKENNGWRSIKCISNNLGELLGFYKDFSNEKIPLFIAAIHYGLENKLPVPVIFNLETTVPHHGRFTDEFNVFYSAWCDGNKF